MFKHTKQDQTHAALALTYQCLSAQLKYPGARIGPRPCRLRDRPHALGLAARLSVTIMSMHTRIATSLHANHALKLSSQASRVRSVEHMLSAYRRNHRSTKSIHGRGARGHHKMELEEGTGKFVGSCQKREAS